MIGTDLFQVLFQGIYLCLNHIPDKFGIDCVIAVNESVAKANDSGDFGNQGDYRLVFLGSLPERLTYDFKLPLDGGTEERGTAEMVEFNALAEFADPDAGGFRVLKPLEVSWLHKSQQHPG